MSPRSATTAEASARTWSPLPHWLLHPLALVVIATLATTWAAIWLWQTNERELLDRSRYQLTWDRLQTPLQPDYLKDDVKKIAYDGSHLSEVNLLDRDAVKKVHAAFAVQSWIEDVQVRKDRSAIQVGLTFRRPVALVEFGDSLLMPVDMNGIVLEGEQLQTADLKNYLRISVQSPQVGSILHGSPWPDSRVIAAAMIADWVAPHAAEWGITRIAHVPIVPNSIAPEGDFELLTAKGTAGIRVMWGSPPGFERSHEATPHQKLEALAQWVNERGSLEDLGTTQTIDIRSGQITPLSRE